MDIYKEIIENLELGQIVALATIVKTKGSTPRKTGAKMLVYSDSSISGTVGGGDFERFVIEDCLKLIESNSKNILKKYSFSIQGENAVGMCCGGNVEVFMELITKPNRLLIYGAGHIGKELSKLASGSSFDITVIDDRVDVIDSIERVKTHFVEIDYEANLPELDDSCYVVIVSRSHQTDYTILKSILINNPKYIGLIGSKAKTTKMFTRLKKEGVKQKLLDRVHTPIGLDIKAEGPFEIAVSILAELIAQKNESC